MTAQNPPDRCRIVLIAPPGLGEAALRAALSGGDVASVILPAHERDTDIFQMEAAPLVAAAQAAGAAVMIAGEPRVASRLKADGVHVEEKKAELADIVARHQREMMVGAGGAATRDEALELGETQPDYLFFGRFGYDNRPGPHPRNLSLGQWWSQMVRIPCIVQGGADLASLTDVARAGVDFVALSSAVFNGETDPAEAVRKANALLDEHAVAGD